MHCRSLQMMRRERVTPGQPAGGPTVLRILLGAQLRKLRELAGISREDAGYQIRASGSKISRLELGRVSFRERDVGDLLDFYGAEPAQLEALVALAREANRPPWWQRLSDVVPDWFAVYVGLEEAAELIRNYEVQFVPGLLQTEDYARSVVELGAPGAPAEEVERRVALRMGRQKLLSREQPPRLWAVVDEAALRRPVGSTRIQLDQLRYLQAQNRTANLTLQIVGYGVGGHAAPGPFSIMRFGEHDLPDVVYVEHLTSAMYLDKQADIDRYLLAMERLCVVAKQPKETPGILAAVMKELEESA